MSELSAELSLTVPVHTLCFDVCDQQATERAVESGPADFKNIDILVNNAGNAHGLSPIQVGCVADCDVMIDNNFKDLLYVTKAVLPQMIVRKCGHIVNISPGSVNTEFSSTRFKGDKEKVSAAYRDMMPLSANDVAAAFYLLLLVLYM